jgi:ribosomal protein S18 acetylase RimI-like enzyme
LTEARIREARTGDVSTLVNLIRALGYEVDEDGVGARLGDLADQGRPTLIAETDRIVGCITLGITPVLHRPRPVGRITMLVVAEEARGQGWGRLLVEAAEHYLREAGCGLIEVTSNLRRADAHAFYERLGYERTSYRFYRPLID